MILLTILLVLTIGNIVWLILDLSIINKYWSILLIILFLTGVFGWGMMGLSIIQTTKNVEITYPIEITKSSTTVFVEVNNKAWEFKDHKDFININDSTSFYYEIDYNLYNIEVREQLKYKN